MTDIEFIQTLATIRVTSGAKAKQALLKSCESHKEYLRLAYDPMINFHVTAQRFSKDFNVGRDDELPIAEFFEDVARKIHTGNKLIEFIYAVMNWKSRAVIDFCISVLDKDLHLGMKAKSLNKVFPGLVFEYPIMLAERENKEKFDLHFKKYDWIYFNEKIDGIRCVVEVTPTGCKFNSRTGKPLPDFLTENIEKDLVSNPFFHGMELDGEIASDSFQGLMKIVQRKNVDFDSMLIRNSCRFHIFDLPKVPGDQDFRAGQLHNFPESNFVKKLKYHKVKCDFALIKAIAKRFIDAGKEGIIIKKPDGKYEGKRSFTWMKFKGKESLDLKIIGVELGVPGGKYQHTCGNLVLDYEGKEVRCGSGMSDSERDDFWKNREQMIGRICQISFMEPTETNSVRQPVYECIRIDKLEPEGD